MLEDIIAEAARKANTRPASNPSWAQVFIASLEASGFVIVPIEATNEMMGGEWNDVQIERWKAVLAARPKIAEAKAAREPPAIVQETNEAPAAYAPEWIDATSTIPSRAGRKWITMAWSEKERAAAKAMFESDPAFKDAQGVQKWTWDNIPCDGLDPRRYWLAKARAALAAAARDGEAAP